MRGQVRLRRWVGWALLFPLLQTGTCVEIIQRTAINGFFDAVTPVLAERLDSQLGQQADAPAP